MEQCTVYSQLVFQIMESAGEIQNIDVDLVKEFSNLLTRCFEMSTGEVTMLEHFPRSLEAFTRILTCIHSADLNKSLVCYLSTVANRLSQKFARQSQPVQ